MGVGYNFAFCRNGDFLLGFHFVRCQRQFVRGRCRPRVTRFKEEEGNVLATFANRSTSGREDLRLRYPPAAHLRWP